MRKFIQEFPQHIEDAIKIAESIKLNLDPTCVENIVISGQGGSAIGGIITKNLLSSKVTVPIIINKNYNTPSFMNHNTLFIASSYSGNTEETLSALKEAEDKKSYIFSITSGGKLLNISQEKAYDHIVIPDGGAPRAMLCYSVVQMLFVISLLSNHSIEDLKQVLLSVKKYLINNQTNIIKDAGSVVDKIKNKMPFIYAFEEFEGVALRFKQQLNENSKRHACYNLIPEMNHNEIVPWVNKNLCVVPIFLNGQTVDRNKKRMEINMRQISQCVDGLIELKADNVDYFKQYFYFVHLLDWVSLMIAEKENIDPDDITLINSLKEELKKYSI